MRKFGSAAIALILTLFILTDLSTAASLVMPGSKCSKAGLVQVVGTKKFTCTKVGSKLFWNKGVTIASKPKASVAATSEPLSAESPTPTASPSASSTLVKFKNCSEAKAAGAAPLTKAKTPELYELNSGLDRDKDGVACEN
jgi:hypothetical protein